MEVWKLQKKLIDIAKESGLDAVKFQKRTIELVYSKETLNIPRESPWEQHKGSKIWS